MSSRHPLRHTALVVVAALTATLGACQSAPMPLPPIASELSDSAWPYANDEMNPDRLFDHAHSLVTRYLETTDTITREGGVGSQRMASLTTSTWFPAEEAAFAHYRTESLRTIGDTEFDSLVIQSVSESVTGDIHVDVIACVDATWVWLLPDTAPNPPEGLFDWLRWGHEDRDISDEQFEQWSEYLDTVSPQPGEREAIVFWLVGATASSLAIDGTINWEGAHACHTTVID
jgi:hypothetical protein